MTDKTELFLQKPASQEQTQKALKPERPGLASMYYVDQWRMAQWVHNIGVFSRNYYIIQTKNVQIFFEILLIKYLTAFLCYFLLTYKFASISCR
jgi:TFIIF-interacting CTD phosphatase-like protein